MSHNNPDHYVDNKVAHKKISTGTEDAINVFPFALTVSNVGQSNLSSSVHKLTINTEIYINNDEFTILTPTPIIGENDIPVISFGPAIINAPDISLSSGYYSIPKFEWIDNTIEIESFSDLHNYADLSFGSKLKCSWITRNSIFIFDHDKHTRTKYIFKN